MYWFRATRTPFGSAPEPVRARWVGVPLPVRRPRPAEGPERYTGVDAVDRSIRRAIADGVAVDPADAIAALEYYGHADAAEWWRTLLRERPATRGFVFRRSEGELLPPRLAFMLHPELEEFGV
jgi:hypothetical protein